MKSNNNYSRKDITGERFGRLVAIKRIDGYYTKTNKRKEKYRSAWLCKCDCGNEKIVALSSLTCGNTKSCGCLFKEKVYKGYKDLGGQQWSRIKHQAKMRNLNVDITIKDAWELFEKQDRKCALSGLPIELKSNYKGVESNNTASLDRIDNSNGYTIDNVQWVHKIINIMRNRLSVDEFIMYCRKVSEYNES